jgi:hypothetical protein
MRYVICVAVMLAAVMFAVAFAASAANEKAAAEKAPAEKAPAEKPAAEKLSEEGFVPIFNGKDLTGWDGDPKLWSVKDGAIHGETTKETMVKGNNTFCIWQGGKVEDFELRLSCKMVGGNSGIQYRSFTRPEKWVVGGYQMEVSDSGKSAGFIYGELFRGGLANVGDKTVYGKDGKKQVVGKLGDVNEIAKSFKVNDWNDYRIVARGHHIEQYLNGVQTVDMVDEAPQALLSGVIALQIHQGYVMVVEFKDIRLKTFPKEGEALKPETPKADAPKPAQ